MLDLREIAEGKGKVIKVTKDGKLTIMDNKRNKIKFETITRKMAKLSEVKDQTVEGMDKVIEALEQMEQELKGLITEDVEEYYETYGKEIVEKEEFETLLRDTIIEVMVESAEMGKQKRVHLK